MCAVNHFVDLIGADDEDQEEDGLQLVTFKVNGEEYGVGIMQVREIIRMSAITRLPQTPPYVEGIMSLRGEVLLVIDLRKRLHLPPVEHTAKSRIVVVTVAGRAMGLVVDSITAVRRIADTEIKQGNQISHLLGTSYVQGIARLENLLIMVLDLDVLLTAEELVAVQAAQLG